MQSNIDWKPYFPFKQIRKEQGEALDFISENLIFGKKEYVIAELGTGVGKSAIAVTLARLVYENNIILSPERSSTEEEDIQTYILTSQKILQDQYIKDFPYTVSDIRSSSNFQCSWTKNQTCADTMRVLRVFKDKDISSNIKCNKDDCSCPYKVAKTIFKKAVAGVTNYSYFLSETTYAKGLKPRGLLICDEAHNIESEVRKWATITIDEQFSTKELGLLVPKSFGGDGEVLKWVEEKYAPALSKLIKRILLDIENRMQKDAQTPEFQKLTKKYTDLDKHICQINRYVEEIGGGKKEEYVVTTENEKGKRVFNLKPINIFTQTNNGLYNNGIKKLLMSATILDKKIYSRSACIPNNKSAFIQIETPFKPSSYGIVYQPIGKMSKSNILKSIKGVKTAISKILDAHPDEKGVIHTSSYEITKAVSEIVNDRLLIQNNNADRNLILEKHIKSKESTVLVSPAMVEGIDLKDDLGRLQIICKVPFPYLGDEVVSYKLKNDPEWYAWVTARTIIQAVGRCVRNENDWTHTYILDECFGDFFMKWYKLFPSQFSEMKVIDT